MESEQPFEEVFEEVGKMFAAFVLQRDLARLQAAIDVITVLAERAIGAIEGQNERAN